MNDDGTPVTEVIRGGYRLDLELVPTVRGQLAGYVQITLPDFEESFVAGDIQVATTHLRYRDGEVDRSFDHLDTLYFVTEEHLEKQYKTDDIESVSFEGSFLDSLEGRAETIASVHLKDGRVGKHVIKAARTEFGWNVLGAESTAATDAAGFKSVYSILPPGGMTEPPAPRKVPATAAQVAARERALSFDQLGALEGQGAAVELVNGRREQGVLRGISNGKLLLEATKSGGVIQFKFGKGEIRSLRLNSGELIRVDGLAAERSAAASSGQLQAQAAPLRVGDLDVTRFLNKSVKVVTTSGKVTTGVFRGVNKDRLVIETLVGGGKVDYTVPASQLVSIDFATP
jgi:hypothetical protein